MSMHCRVARLMTICLTMLSLSAGASVITSGQITQIAPPASVAVGATEDDSQMVFFLERTGLALPGALAAEVTAPTTVTNGIGITPGIIGAGTRVDSYFLHFDSVTPGPITLTGTITFGTDILGVMLFGASLDASDLILGGTSTGYPAAGDFFRGTSEIGSGGDIVTLSGDRRTLTVQSRVSVVSGFSGIDQLRIVVATVPEPGTISLLALGLLVAGLGRRLNRAV